MKVRTTKTASGKTAVQVIERSRHTTSIIKHIGSAQDRQELDALVQLAHQYIRDQNQTTPLFPQFDLHPQEQHLIAIKNLEFTKTSHHFAYEFFSFFYERIGFHLLGNAVLKDLAIIRLIEPASKIASLALLQEYFGITHGHDKLYKNLRAAVTHKDRIEEKAITYAKQYLAFDFSIVFYDVTTLYFETFTEDADITDEKGLKTVGMRKNGFGKEHKPGQPQILIGLVVTKEGYPVSVEMFPGKTFEGHTIIPVIKKLKEKYAITTLTIVADAAMLSVDNIQAIADAKLSYIVGARLGNISHTLLQEISAYLEKTEGKYYVAETKHGTLICTYSHKRAAKDRADRKKQLEKSQYQIDHPEKVKRKARFVTEETKASLKLNEELMNQDELREGIKGYYTNLTLDEKVTAMDGIERYHELWHVEQAFRIAKSDLKARPIFHHTKETIQAHIIVVFVSLCIARSIELFTKLSIQKVTKYIWPIVDIEFHDTLSKKTFIKRMKTKENPMVELWKTLSH